MADEAEAAASTPGPSVQRQRLSAFFAHPLVLILLGGVISAILAPLIVQRWQDHQDRQKQHDVQVQLVTDMTESSAQFITAAQRYVDNDLGSGRPVPGAEHDYAVMRRALDDLRVRDEVIFAQLLAYYGAQAPVTNKWSRFGDVAETYGDLLTAMHDHTSNAHQLATNLAKATGFPITVPSTADPLSFVPLAEVVLKLNDLRADAATQVLARSPTV